MNVLQVADRAGSDQRSQFGEALLEQEVGQVVARLAGGPDSVTQSYPDPTCAYADRLRPIVDRLNGTRQLLSLHRFRLADLLRAGVRGEELIEQAERVAHRPGRLAGHQGQRRVGHLDALRLRDLTQPGDDLPEGHQLEVVPLDPRKDGRGQLLRICRGQEELDVARRLLQRLEQRVERGAAQHVDLVDDVDFVTIARG